MPREMSRRALLGAVGGVWGGVGVAAQLTGGRDATVGGGDSSARIAAAGRQTRSPPEPSTVRERTEDGTPADGPDRRRETVLAGTVHETTAHVIEGGGDGPTTFVVGGMHGDERAGHRAARAIAEWSVARGRLVVLPAADRVALRSGTRSGGGRDLNRQFPATDDRRPMSRLARAIWRLLRRHDPDWVFDLHSSRGVYRSGDGGVGQAVFPTDVPPARARAGRAVEALNDRFDLSGRLAYRVGNDLDGDRPMLVHRVGQVLERPGYILETAEAAPLADQVAWHRFAVAHVMEQSGQVPDRGR